jgi:UDP-glucose 4-epimerase
MDKKKYILVTGGCGFIGSNFINKLIDHKKNVIILDNLSSGSKKNLALLKKKSNQRNSNLIFFKKNLCKKNEIYKIFEKFHIDYIFHFAAFSSVHESIKNPKKIMNNNILSTKNLIYCLKKFNVENLIFSSSASVYGNAVTNKGIKESNKLKPINPYGKSKLTCEKIILKELKKKKLKFCILRYFNVVGKNLSKSFEKKKNLNLFEKIRYYLKKNKIFSIHGKNLQTLDGTPVRDFISMSDLIAAHMECFKQKNSLKFWNKIYNVGINKGFSVLQVITNYNTLFKNKIRFNFIDKKIGEIDQSVANNKKFIRNSNWSPKDKTIKKLLNSFF